MSTVPTDSPRRRAIAGWIRAAAIALILFVVVSWCAGGIIRTQNAALRMTAAGQLTQLGFAMHAFHDSTGNLPGANAPYTDEKGRVSKYPVSWRVRILPYIEEDKLFKRYDFDEPWDGPHNIELLELMPKTFRHPKAEAQNTPVGYTHFRVFVSPPDAKPSALFTDGSPGPKFSEIVDRTSDTILIVEAEEAVPWTMPEALIHDRHQPLPKLGGLFKESFQAVLADGSVRFFRISLPDDKLRAWITKDGGETVGDE